VRKPRFLALGLGLGLALLGGCRENLATAPHGVGPDVEGPFVLLRPASDTTVDSLGVLNIQVQAIDQSPIGHLDLIVVGGAFGFAPLVPNDTIVTVIYPIALGQFKHSSFQYYVVARDVLNHETATDTVTVTVR